MTLKTFAPSGADSITLAVTTTSAQASIDANSSTVRIVNNGTGDAFLTFGTGATVSTTAKMLLKAGATETFTKGTSSTVAAICAAGSTSLNITNGEGL